MSVEDTEFKLMEDGKWSIFHNGRYFKVNDLGKKVSQLILQGMSNEDIQIEITSLGYEKIDEETIIELRKKINEKKQNEKERIIKFRLQVINLIKHQNKLKSFTFLFNSYIVVFILLLWIGLLIFHFEEIFKVDRFEFYRTINDKPYLLVIYSFVSLLIILVHEFGHAISSVRYNVPPKEIGFGFYLYFPVFFYGCF